MIRRCLLVIIVAATASAQDAVSLLRKLDEGFVAVFEKVAPSVVVIEATKAEDDEAGPASRPFGFLFRDEDATPDGRREKDWSLPELPTQSQGSGFIIRADGYLITNRHVIADAEKIEVRGYDGRRWTGRLVAGDEQTDIAVLKIDAKDLPVAPWGDSDALRIGQLVCAIGAPFNQDYSFTCGWVSGKGRSNLLAPASPRTIFEDYIQTDAFINPGNSGGPLFDVEGRIIGMNTLINGLGRGLAFAIPSNLLRDVSDQLIASGRVRRPWLGVRVTSLDGSKTLREQFPQNEHGVVINTIEAGTSAARSELQPGDLLTAIDGTAIRDGHALVRQVQRKKVGQTLQLSVLRKGQALTVSLVTGEQSTAPAHIAVPRPAPSAPVDLGLKLVQGDPAGAVVFEVASGSPAARADLKVGDRITEVGAEAVSHPEAALQAIEKTLSENPSKGALVQFLRAGKKSWAVIERPSH